VHDNLNSLHFLLSSFPILILLQGRGVPRDDAAALTYYTLSSAQGDQVIHSFVYSGGGGRERER